MGPRSTHQTRPYIHSSSLGTLEGLTILSGKEQNPQCHYLGGIPYAVPPLGPLRWRKPRPCPPCYRYGTGADPGKFDGACRVCPQVRVKEEDWSEDCLQLNMWIPTGEPPPKGWPVVFYIHGGFLQVGTPNSIDPSALLGETPCQCVFVTPAYRLNVFGFLASPELAEREGDAIGNFGFWDQRVALGWTYKNVSLFGGNPSNITVGGYSAGAHSAFHNLIHDLFPPSSTKPSNQTPIVHRILLSSNAPPPAPKPPSQTHRQYLSLLHHLPCPTPAPSTLRTLPASALLAAATHSPHHEFRAVLDADFIPRDYPTLLTSPLLAARLLTHNIQLAIGECADERSAYTAWRPPAATALAQDPLRAIQTRLEADFTPDLVRRALAFYFPTPWHVAAAQPRTQEPARGPATARGASAAPGQAQAHDWRSAFGAVYADVQVHAPARHFLSVLARNLALRSGGAVARLVRRYRIEYRVACAEEVLPRSWGVAHGSDVGVWFWGNGWGGGLGSGEKRAVRGFLGVFWGMVLEEDGGDEWGTGGDVRLVRRLRGDGGTDVVRDEDWERGCQAGEALLGGAREKGAGKERARL